VSADQVAQLQLQQSRLRDFEMFEFRRRGSACFLDERELAISIDGQAMAMAMASDHDSRDRFLPPIMIKARAEPERVASILRMRALEFTRNMLNGLK